MLPAWTGPGSPQSPVRIDTAAAKEVNHMAENEELEPQNAEQSADDTAAEETGADTADEAGDEAAE